MARIGVAPNLTNVKEALTEMGHEIIDIHNENDAKNCDYAVISGVDENMMGIADVTTPGSVINAQGASTDEVCQMIEEKLQ